jgi:hypothetical protein
VCTENHKSPLKEIREYINKWKKLAHVHGFEVLQVLRTGVICLTSVKTATQSL